MVNRVEITGYIAKNPKICTRISNKGEKITYVTAILNNVANLDEPKRWITLVAYGENSNSLLNFKENDHVYVSGQLESYRFHSQFVYDISVKFIVRTELLETNNPEKNKQVL